MADELPEVYKIKISSEDVHAYFEAKHLSTTCELCNTNSWSTSTEVKNHIPHITLYDESTKFEDILMYPVVFSKCDNCGNIKIIARKTVAEWILKNQKDL